MGGLCVAFFNEAFHLRFRYSRAADTLAPFVSADYKQQVATKYFEMHGVRFKCNLAPNGIDSSANDRGFVQFFIELAEMTGDDRLSHAVVHYTMTVGGAPH